MARIRTIKPTFFTSRSVAELPPPVRLTYIGLWTHVDDRGRAVDDARLVKAALWPLDDKVTIRVVETHLAKLAGLGFICRYEVNGESFLHVCKWTDHQKINRPQSSRIPPPPHHTDSVNDHGTRSESARHDHAPLTDRSSQEGKGREEERERRSSSSFEEPPKASSVDDDDVVREAIRLLSVRAMHRFESETGDVVAMPPRWLAADSLSRRERHASRIDELVAEHPGVSADELADLLEPPPAPPQLSPEDASVVARQQRDELLVERDARPCPACDGGFRWEDESYERVVRCESCHGTGVDGGVVARA